MSEKRKDSSGRILKTGESQRSNGTYQFRYKDIHKEAKYVYAPTLQELRKKEEQISKDLSDGIDSSKGNITLGEVLDEYITLKSARSRRSTTEKNTSVVRRIKKYDICEMSVNRISKTTAKKWIIQLKEDGYAYGTINNMKAMVCAAFENCVEDDLIRKNPMRFNLATVIEDDTKCKSALTLKEYSSFLSFVGSHEKWKCYYNMIVAMVETGVRASELCGLTIKDIDFKNKMLSISKQLLQQGQGGIYYIEQPKTKSGTRIIPLTETALEAFQSAIKERPCGKTETIVDGYCNFIFITRNGTPRTAHDIRRILQRIKTAYVAETGNDIIITPHILRHTFCTNLAEASIPIKDLQYLMGHSDIRMTMNVYSHTSLDSVKEHFYKAAASQ